MEANFTPTTSSLPSGGGDGDTDDDLVVNPVKSPTKDDLEYKEIDDALCSVKADFPFTVFYESIQSSLETALEIVNRHQPFPKYFVEYTPSIVCHSTQHSHLLMYVPNGGMNKTARKAFVTRLHQLRTLACKRVMILLLSEQCSLVQLSALNSYIAKILKNVYAPATVNEITCDVHVAYYSAKVQNQKTLVYVSQWLTCNI